MLCVIVNEYWLSTQQLDNIGGVLPIFPFFGNNQAYRYLFWFSVFNFFNQNRNQWKDIKSSLEKNVKILKFYMLFEWICVDVDMRCQYLISKWHEIHATVSESYRCLAVCAKRFDLKKNRLNSSHEVLLFENELRLKLKLRESICCIVNALCRKIPKPLESLKKEESTFYADKQRFIVKCEFNSDRSDIDAATESQNSSALWKWFAPFAFCD